MLLMTTHLFFLLLDTDDHRYDTTRPVTGGAIPVYITPTPIKGCDPQLKPPALSLPPIPLFSHGATTPVHIIESTELLSDSGS